MNRTSLNDMIGAPIVDVFRRLSVKRRDTQTGLFESNWQDISSDVKSYGKIVNQLDNSRRNRFIFGNAKITMSNESGAYSPHDVPSSLWFGYLNQQRTLVKIECGFVKATRAASGVYARVERPAGTSFWDQSFWDDNAWDGGESPLIFKGVLSGDIPLSDTNEVVFNVKPLISVFQDFPAQNLTGWTSTGMTASQFVTMLRDQTDGAGSYVFRPFFEDSTAFWDISTTTNIFANLNTSTADGVIGSNCWDIIESLAEAENFVPYIDRSGVFRFVSRDAVTDNIVYNFYGAGFTNRSYGHTIKQVMDYSFKISDYYSRVQVQWSQENTSTSYETVGTQFQVTPSSNPWVLGDRTLKIQNFYIQTATVANILARELFEDVSGLNKEISFITSLVPHLDLLDRFAVYYDPAPINPRSLWNVNNWAADDTSTSKDLILDDGVGDGLVVSGQQFKFLSFTIDLDNLENTFIGREV